MNIRDSLAKFGFDAAENEPPQVAAPVLLWHVWGPSEESSWCPHRQGVPLSRPHAPRDLAPTVGFVNIGVITVIDPSGAENLGSQWGLKGAPTRLFQLSVDLFFFQFRMFVPRLDWVCSPRRRVNNHAPRGWPGARKQVFFQIARPQNRGGNH